MLHRCPRLLASVFLAAAFASLVPGCASVDFDYPKSESFAVQDTDQTPLGQLVASLDGIPDGESAFYPLSDGVEALSVRLLMAERAEQTIDAQYYLLTPDVTGLLFLRALLDAADRGVRVRLLLDDILTVGHGSGMRALAAHPNLELRIFNPFANRSWRVLSVTHEFTRVNRRMHNKSFTVDNQATVIGGRNIAAEYFGADEQTHFGDLDLLGLGEVSGEVSRMFDLYWNDRLAVPAAALTGGEPAAPAAELAALRESIDEQLADLASTPYGNVLAGSLKDIQERENDELDHIPFQLVYDPPAKARTQRPKDLETITTPLKASVMGAQSELLVVSPYFVPRKPALEGFRELRDRGVRVRVITNSLAANNHSVVHAGYTTCRKPLLGMGVELFELRPDAMGRGPDIGDPPSARSTLHTKAFIVDRRWVFIGSFNWDPRSAFINTEMGILLDSPQLAESLTADVDAALPYKAYRLALSDRGSVRWIALEDEREVELDREPLTGFWERFTVGFMRLLPIKSQL